MRKIDRMMGIILALNKKKKMTAKDLADLFEVDVRTIYRDVQSLSEMNIPIVSHIGSEGGYSIMDKYFIPPIMFNKDEVFALLIAKKITDIIEIPGYTQYVNSAFLKVRDTISEELQEELQKVEDKILFDIKNIEIEKKDLRFFTIIKRCMEENLKLNIEYFSTKRFNTKSRVIRPFGLIYEEGAWYIIAYCEFNKEITTFRMDRIKQAEITEEKFSMPEGFNISQYNCRYNYQTDYLNPESCTVKLKLSKSLYYSIKDYLFLKHARETEYEDYFILDVKTTNPDRYVYFSFQYFNGMEILEPRWLRDEFKRRLEKLYDNYRREDCSEIE